MMPSGQMCKEDLSLPGMLSGMDTYTVVVASVICEGGHMDLRISELPGVYDNIGSGPGTPCRKPGDVLHVPNLCSLVDDGLKEPSQGTGNMSDLPCSVSAVLRCFRAGPARPRARRYFGTAGLL